MPFCICAKPLSHPLLTYPLSAISAKNQPTPNHVPTTFTHSFLQSTYSRPVSFFSPKSDHTYQLWPSPNHFLKDHPFLTKISPPGIIPNTFLLLVPGSRNAVLNWVLKLNYFLEIFNEKAIKIMTGLESCNKCCNWFIIFMATPCFIQ